VRNLICTAKRPRNEVDLMSAMDFGRTLSNQMSFETGTRGPASVLGKF